MHGEHCPVTYVRGSQRGLFFFSEHPFCLIYRCFSDIFETIRPLSCFGSCFVSLCLDKTTQQNVVVKTYLKHKLGTAMLLQVRLAVLHKNVDIGMKKRNFFRRSKPRCRSTTA